MEADGLRQRAAPGGQRNQGKLLFVLAKFSRTWYSAFSEINTEFILSLMCTIMKQNEIFSVYKYVEKLVFYCVTNGIIH